MNKNLIQPYPWQQPIIDKITASIKKNRYAINASGTGAGKTVMALATARDLALAGVIEHVLVVAPKVALTQWYVTAEGMGVKELILSCINPEKISKPTGCAFYQVLRVDSRRPSKKTSGKWVLPVKTLVIWDEPHRNASGIKSKATEALAKLKTYDQIYLLAMSATLADSPLKLRALGYWAGMHQFIESSFYYWCRQNGCFYQTQVNGRQALKFTSNRKAAQQNMAVVRQSFKDAYVAIPLSDIPNFPEQTLEVQHLDLANRDRAELEKAYAEMAERLKKKAKSQLAEIGRCRERIEFCKASAVASIANSHLSDGKSVVIFCNYTSARERIRDELLRLGVTDIGMIYGGQNEEERQNYIDRFQDNTLHVMLVMTAAGGAALSLHDTKHERPRVSLITPSFNAAEVRQALGRIRRCNGTNVEQYFVLAAGTIEDRVSMKLEAKLNNIDTLNDKDLLAE